MKQRIISSAFIVGGIILGTTLLGWIMNIALVPDPSPLRTAVSVFFPHQVLASIKYVLLGNSNFSYYIPSLNYLFVILLFVAIYYFRAKGHIRLLLIACIILILSTALDIPGLITYYNYQLQAWRNYTPMEHTGILALINESNAEKPSLPLLITHVTVLLLYITWAIWAMTQAIRVKHTTAKTNKAF